MVFRKSDFNEDSNDNWNIAKGFTTDVTLEHILDLRKFERIARYGIFDFENIYVINDDMKVDARINGLGWYADELDSLISDNIFAIKPSQKEDKTLLEELRGRIKVLKEAIQYTRKEIIHRDKKIVVIDEKVFSETLDYLIKIKIEVLEAMNRSDLIFKGIDDYDPDKVKAELEKLLGEEG